MSGSLKYSLGVDWSITSQRWLAEMCLWTGDVKKSPRFSLPPCLFLDTGKPKGRPTFFLFFFLGGGVRKTAEANRGSLFGWL